MDELNTRYSASWLSDDLQEDELLSRFRAQLARITSPDDAPQAEDIIHNIPVYAGDTVRTAAQDSAQRKALLAEWTDIFGHGAGVFAIRNAMDDLAVLDRATAIFTSIIEAENQVQLAAEIILPRQVQMTVSGTRLKSTVWQTLKILQPIMVMIQLPWRPKHGLVAAIR